MRLAVALAGEMRTASWSLQNFSNLSVRDIILVWTLSYPKSLYLLTNFFVGFHLSWLECISSVNVYYWKIFVCPSQDQVHSCWWRITPFDGLFVSPQHFTVMPIMRWSPWLGETDGELFECIIIVPSGKLAFVIVTKWPLSFLLNVDFWNS